MILKVNQPHLWYYRDKNKTLGPAMTPDHPLRVIAICCPWQAEPLISTTTHQTFDLDLSPWPRTLTLTLIRPLTLTSSQVKGNSDVKTQVWAFDHDLWPEIQAQQRSRSTPIPEIKVKGQMVQTGELRQTDKRMDERYKVHSLQQ